METRITRDTPLASLTVGQLCDLIKGLYVAFNPLETYLKSQEQGVTANRSAATLGATPRRYVYGLKGIMELFGVSNVTAQRYKRGVIRDAVSQYGRTIVTDADLALQLFREHKESRQQQQELQGQMQKELRLLSGEMQKDSQDPYWSRENAFEDFQDIIKNIIL